jgi:hypothetical protein
MGVCIQSHESSFRITDEAKAFDALKTLGNGKHGRTFTWMSGVNFDAMDDIGEALEAWGYVYAYDHTGGSLECENEKLGQETLAFEAIAPFVESGSYVKMHDDCGGRWTWQWVDGVFSEVKGWRKPGKLTTTQKLNAYAESMGLKSLTLDELIESHRHLRAHMTREVAEIDAMRDRIYKDTKDRAKEWFTDRLITERLRAMSVPEMVDFLRED